MKWFLGTYTLRFNRRHKLFGHLCSGRYKSLIVDGSGSGYLMSPAISCHFPMMGLPLEQETSNAMIETKAKKALTDLFMR